ncbi:hypothetical protein ALC57_00600 [Trachymyrmex cornetzi]|uniref:ISXO2-like transposase domain-containing protein n=1 Tax=Trachymyrmex cornetzi TaxID=471704 RepID=A0A151JRD5_9HYME|nr:hypothetical protein ALC57_00600 [Trachymyrmex cornetzi]
MIRVPRHQFIMSELQLNNNTVVDWTNFCRELLHQWILKRQKPIGGNGKIVEIDEAKIGKRKYNTGRIIRGQWIIGGIERSTTNIFIIPVPDRRSETLLSIIREHVALGSIIHTDKWRVYDNLDNDTNYTY